MKDLVGGLIIGFCAGIVFIALAIYFKSSIVQTEDGIKVFEHIDTDVIRHRDTGVCYYLTDYGITPLYNAYGTLYTLGG